MRTYRDCCKAETALLNFTKMTGNGNDFIVVENFHNEASDQELSKLARTLCKRKYSIGADGLLLLEKSAKAHFKMRIFNSDGSEGEMCGNGARCICRYASDHNIAPGEMTFETLAGIYKAKVCGCEVKVDMGSIDLSKARYNQIIVLNDSELTYNFLEVGVPHCVVFLDAQKTPREELLRIGRSLRNNKTHFPRGTNVNFVKILDKNRIYLVTYERGVEDLTESCGTGSAAGAIVSTVLRGMESPIRVTNLGGENKVFVELKDDLSECKISIQGRAVYVAKGIICQESTNENIK